MGDRRNICRMCGGSGVITEWQGKRKVERTCTQCGGTGRVG